MTILNQFWANWQALPDWLHVVIIAVVVVSVASQIVDLGNITSDGVLVGFLAGSFLILFLTVLFR